MIGARHARGARPLLIIAPSLYEAHHTAVAFGIDPKAMENVRVVTNAYALRGTGPGTPFISQGREGWGGTQTGYDLDLAVTAYQRNGCLRIAADDDIAAVMGEDTHPPLEAAGARGR